METKTHFKLARLDESSLWAKEIREQVGKVYGVYLIDTNEQTYCCELTPSYAAYFLYDTTDCELSEFIADVIWESGQYTEPISYFHVHSLTKFAHDFGEAVIEDDYATAVEDMIEYCKANWYV